MKVNMYHLFLSAISERDLCRTDCLLSVKAKFATDSRDELHFYFYRIVILVQYVSSRFTDLI